MFKKSALAVVVAASMIPAAAMADTTLYGQARVFFGQSDTKTTASGASTSSDEWQMRSDASRIGIKGSTELEHDLEAIYKFEYQVDPVDSGTKAEGINGNKVEQVFKRRNQYLGLKGDFGQVIFGRHDTPLKKSQGKVDLFSDVPNSDIKNSLEGENRLNNLVYFKSPKIADAVNIHVAFAPGEGNDVDGVTDTSANPQEENGIADQKSVAVTFKNDNLYLALANDMDIDGMDSLTRLTAQFKADMFGAGLIYQAGEEQGANADEETGFVVSGYFKATDNLKLKAQIASNEEERSTGTVKQEKEQFTIGADYKLGKKTTAMVFFTNKETTDKDALGAQTSEVSTDLFSLGLIHKF